MAKPTLAKVKALDVSNSWFGFFLIVFVIFDCLPRGLEGFGPKGGGPRKSGGPKSGGPKGGRPKIRVFSLSYHKILPSLGVLLWNVFGF